MSITAAVKRLQDYQLDRSKALNNKAVQRWFSSGSASLSAVYADFDRKDEEAAWLKQYSDTQGGDVFKFQSAGLKVSFLMRCLRDLKMCWNSLPAIDGDRYEYMRILANRLRLTSFQSALSSLDVGSNR